MPPVPKHLPLDDEIDHVVYLLSEGDPAIGRLLADIAKAELQTKGFWNETIQMPAGHPPGYWEDLAEIWRLAPHVRGNPELISTVELLLWRHATMRLQYVGNEPLTKVLKRDLDRQTGIKKPRRPDITAWIKDRLVVNRDAKGPDLWKQAPDWLTDQIGYRRFASRVTRIRKEIGIARK